MFSSKTPHFVMIVLERTLREEKLWIPKKYSEKYGGSLGEAVHVKLPCGSEWKMKLSKQNGNKIRLETGWPEFAKHYSLKLGHILVFSYLGDSKFNLVIFDTTLVEIDYPLTEPKTELQEDDSDENPRPLKRPTTPSSPQKQEVKEIDNDLAMKPLRGNEKIAALEKTSAFKSKRPFFKLLVQPSYISNGAVIQSKFANKYLTDKGSVVRLKVSNERTWSVKYNRHRQNRSTHSREFITRFGSGWIKFARDNNLKPYDICVFVLIKGSSKKSFEVKIIRENDDNGSIFSDNPNNGNKREQKMSKPKKQCSSTSAGGAQFECQKPCFKVVLTKSYIHTYLSVPRDFSERYIEKESDIVLLCNGMTFEIKFYVGFETFGRFTRGWSEFAKCNKLEVGDVCIFELIDRAKMKLTFEVSILRSQAVI